MRTSRTLTLRREVLQSLTDVELRDINGGTNPSIFVSCLAINCVVDRLSDKIAGCDSALRPCISHTCT